ncbi:MAG: LysR family transcriptional regulator [Kofleriaceae bacterium]
MAWLNYQHLYYFWVIAREGGLAKGAAELRLSHSTLSVQLKALETALGERLFERRGRGLVLTPFGRDVQQYAGEIFRLGAELLDFSAGRAPAARRFEVGVVGAIPKTIASRLLAAALAHDATGTVRIRQDSLERLLQELSLGRLHVVLSDALPVAGSAPKLHAHALGSSELLLYGSAALARRYRRGFPASLEGAPMLMPGPEATLRRSLERWLAGQGLRVKIVGEVDDAGALRALGAAGLGLFPVRAALRGEVEEGFGAREVARLTGLRESYFAISLERRVRHPGVAALIEVARQRLPPAPAPRR